MVNASNAWAGLGGLGWRGREINRDTHMCDPAQLSSAPSQPANQPSLTVSHRRMENVKKKNHHLRYHSKGE
jgi:hypothetical protein